MFPFRLQGVLSLLASNDIRGVLKHAGLEVEQLERLGRYGGTVALKLGGLAQKGKQGVRPHLNHRKFSLLQDLVHLPQGK